MKHIIIAADIVPTKSNYEEFISADTDYLIGTNLKSRLESASFIAMNLETPLTDDTSPIKKCGPCLIAPIETIAGIKAINPYFFTLANNHILDQGVSGLESTMKVLSENGIEFSGVGYNLNEARKSYIKMVDGIKVGIYSCTEHEYSIATEIRAGANPYDPLVSFDDVKELKTNCDYLIVLYHGGKEHYRYPSPILQKVFRKFADVGADLVVAQHTHCIGCKEEYNNSTLVYGQGNFLFDHSESEYWKTSLLIDVDLVERQVDYIPLVKKDNCVREAKGKDREDILKAFSERSSEIQNIGFIETRYKKLANEMRAGYLQRFSGGFCKGMLFRILMKITHYKCLNRYYQEESRIAIENVLDCEAHRELAAEVMRVSED